MESYDQEEYHAKHWNHKNNTAHAANGHQQHYYDRKYSQYESRTSRSYYDRYQNDSWKGASGYDRSPHISPCYPRRDPVSEEVLDWRDQRSGSRHPRDQSSGDYTYTNRPQLEGGYKKFSRDGGPVPHNHGHKRHNDKYSSSSLMEKSPYRNQSSNGFNDPYNRAPQRPEYNQKRPRDVSP